MTDSASGVLRVTVSLDPVDVDLIDRLAVLEGSNRSAELRSILGQLRPVLSATVQAFEGAAAARGRLDEAAAAAAAEHLQAIQPRVERLEQDFIGTLAALEGAQAADPRPSNHGGHIPDPSPSTEAPEG